jgi:hypothetical protein
MIKRILLGLVVFTGVVFSQPATTYSFLNFDTGTTTPGYCTPPAFFYNSTSPGTLLVCNASHAFAAAQGNAAQTGAGDINANNQVVWTPVTILPPATTAISGRLYIMTNATYPGICLTAGDSGGSATAFCISNGTTYSSIGYFVAAAAQSTLPTCSSTYEGLMRGVTNSNSQTFGAAIAPAGSFHVNAYCNGTSWIVQ